MKILYIGRLFSGLENSLSTQSWAPTGAPTIFKLIEELDQSANEMRLVLTCKDGSSTWTERSDKTLVLDGLKTPVRVLAGTRVFPEFFGRLRTPLRELRHMWKIWKDVKTFRPDVIYLGNANIWSGGLLARMSKVPVVFRMMGVYPAMRNALKGRRLAHVFMRWCYAAPYRAAICTQDGSGIEHWLDAALSKNVETVTWINGVDIPPAPESVPEPLAHLPQDKTIVLFIGHLDTLKGFEVFIDAVLETMFSRAGKFHALVVGTGNGRDAAEAKIEDANLGNDFTFINRLPHSLIAEAHRRSNIYVSLNRLGNLSNANLEAMKLGQCMVLPHAQHALGIDVITESMFPERTALRIKDADDKEGLVAALLKMHDFPEQRQDQALEMERVAQNMIPTWGERIKKETDLLEDIAAGKQTPSRSLSQTD